jgi:hypothetical protein
MLTNVGEDIPARVSRRLDPDETVVATLHGFLESGLALTDRRLFGWRSTGASLPLPLSAISRILVDTGDNSDRVDISIYSRLPLHAPLILSRRGTEGVSTLAFVADVVNRCGRMPRVELFGSLHRFAFD